MAGGFQMERFDGYSNGNLWNDYNTHIRKNFYSIHLKDLLAAAFYDFVLYGFLNRHTQVWGIENNGIRAEFYFRDGVLYDDFILFGPNQNTSIGSNRLTIKC